MKYAIVLLLVLALLVPTVGAQEPKGDPVEDRIAALEEALETQREVNHELTTQLVELRERTDLLYTSVCGTVNLYGRMNGLQPLDLYSCMEVLTAIAETGEGQDTFTTRPSPGG